jgi:drug/metabolite transporter (DMT)-like permease
LILFSALFAVFALPVILIINPQVLTSVTPLQAIILMVNGVFLTLAIILYLYALDTDETSFVAPFFQLIPVFGFVIGYFFLGEVLSSNQIIGGILILLGGLLLSLELTTGKSKFKKKLALLMIGTSFFYAINAVIFKSIAVDQGFTNSLFWDMLGKFIFGVILFFAVKSYRQQFIQLLKSSGTAVVGLNVFNEILSLIGEFALVFAVLMAPVALVQSVGGLQPAFVLIIGIFLTLFFPKIAQESLQKKLLIQKIIGIVIITIGVYFLEIF